MYVDRPPKESIGLYDNRIIATVIGTRFSLKSETQTLPYYKCNTALFTPKPQITPAYIRPGIGCGIVNNRSKGMDDHHNPGPAYLR